jgi:hypothetical protein
MSTEMVRRNISVLQISGPGRLTAQSSLASSQLTQLKPEPVIRPDGIESPPQACCYPPAMGADGSRRARLCSLGTKQTTRRLLLGIGARSMNGGFWPALRLVAGRSEGDFRLPSRCSHQTALRAPAFKYGSGYLLAAGRPTHPKTNPPERAQASGSPLCQFAELN